MERRRRQLAANATFRAPAARRSSTGPGAGTKRGLLHRLPWRRLPADPLHDGVLLARIRTPSHPSGRRSA